MKITQENQRRPKFYTVRINNRLFRYFRSLYVDKRYYLYLVDCNEDIFIRSFGTQKEMITFVHDYVPKKETLETIMYMKHYNFKWEDLPHGEEPVVKKENEVYEYE